MFNRFPFSALMGIAITTLWLLYKHGIILKLISRYRKIDPQLIAVDTVIFIFSPFIAVSLFSETSSHYQLSSIPEVIKITIPLIIFLAGVQFQKRKDIKNNKAVSYALFDDLIQNLIVASRYESVTETYGRNNYKEYYLSLKSFELYDEFFVETWEKNKVDFYREHSYKNETMPDGGRVESGGIIVTDKGSNNTRQLVANTFNSLASYNRNIFKLNQLIATYNNTLQKIQDTNPNIFLILKEYRNIKQQSEVNNIFAKYKLDQFQILSFLNTHENLSNYYNQIIGHFNYLSSISQTQKFLIEQAKKELSLFIHE